MSKSWDKSYVSNIAAETKLKNQQVYKWLWDRKSRDDRVNERILRTLTCNEILDPFDSDSQIHKISLSYRACLLSRSSNSELEGLEAVEFNG